jgi:hypothetical protein
MYTFVILVEGGESWVKYCVCLFTTKQNFILQDGTGTAKNFVKKYLRMFMFLFYELLSITILIFIKYTVIPAILSFKSTTLQISIKFSVPTSASCVFMFSPNFLPITVSFMDKICCSSAEVPKLWDVPSGGRGGAGQELFV